jgi:hypothetical protein
MNPKIKKEKLNFKRMAAISKFDIAIKAEEKIVKNKES